MKFSAYIAAMHAALLCLVLAVSPAGSGSMTLLGVGQKAAAGGGYVGPGDITGFSGAAGWYGLRAYNAAYAAALGNCLDLVDQAGANPITIKVTSAGNLDVAAINTWVTANSVTNIKITGLYDQSGAGNKAVQATLALMPKLTLNALGSMPMIETLASTNTRLISPTSLALAQPFSLSTVAKRIAVVSLDGLMTDNAATGIFFSDTSGNLKLFAQTSQQNTPATEAVFHAVQTLMNAASSANYVDGTNTVVSATPGSAAWGQTGVSAPGFGATMFFAEGGVWSGDKSANNSALNSNQHAYWGF